ncbi:MAG: alpha/beta fold hydrolase [Ignavibacteria bacterium]|nr:alpha/beta fold hydrolase [Ignavibacteria bacterium]
MPLIQPSTFSPPFYLRNCHVQTMYPTFFRKTPPVEYQRERIETPDGDFFDVDWAFAAEPAERVVIIVHGLDSSTDAKYIRGLSRALVRRGFDVAAMNFRSCSGEMNRLYKSYHSGATEDIHTLVTRIAATKRYSNISLVGCSLGGNAILKYLGEQGSNTIIQKAAALSAPCDLKASALAMASWRNSLYMKRFVRSFQQKIAFKQSVFPPGVTLDHFKNIRTFQDLDDRYTAPAHGFRDAEDYWAKCSAIGFINSIKIPTLLISAKDDSFLTSSCLPIDMAASSEYFFMETPDYGGHLGFVQSVMSGEYWHETRIAEFIR